MAVGEGCPGSNAKRMCCPGAFPFRSVALPETCFNEAQLATAGTGPCGSWCTFDLAVGEGCGPNEDHVCQAGLAPPPAPAVEMPSTAKGLNIKCANWRDQKERKSKNQQEKMQAYCMQQDCEQSMEEVGCRFTDADQHCYTDSGQFFCSQHLGHPDCHDLGADAAYPNEAGPGTWAPVQDVPLYGAAAGEAPYSCVCLKHCQHYSGSTQVKYRCATNVGGPIKVGAVAGSPVEDPSALTITSSSSKKGKCACLCGSAGAGWQKP